MVIPLFVGEEVKTSIGRFVPIIFDGNDWKRDAALKAGYDVDIWIDDSPEIVGKQIIGGGWSQD